jgi:hypothetical protein
MSAFESLKEKPEHMHLQTTIIKQTADKTSKMIDDFENLENNNIARNN